MRTISDDNLTKKNPHYSFKQLFCRVFPVGTHQADQLPCFYFSYVSNEDSFYILPLVVKGVFITVIAGGAWMRVKAYPCTDVYHWGQRARCVYISWFRMAMFGMGKAAVGKEFYRITLSVFPSRSPLTLLLLLRAFVFCLGRFKTTADWASRLCHFLP